MPTEPGCNILGVFYSFFLGIVLMLKLLWNCLDGLEVLPQGLVMVPTCWVCKIAFCYRIQPYRFHNHIDSRMVYRTFNSAGLGKPLLHSFGSSMQQFVITDLSSLVFSLSAIVMLQQCKSLSTIVPGYSDIFTYSFPPCNIGPQSPSLKKTTGIGSLLLYHVIASSACLYVV